MSRIQLLGITGSLRDGAFTQAILESVKDEIAASADLVPHSLGRVPLYNQDLDTETPLPDVGALRDAIARADGLVIVTPEFNYGIPGVLKNALDWASRPHGASALIGKPVVTISASPAFTGGVRAQAQLNETLLAIQAHVVGGPQVVIGEVHDKVKDGRLVDRVALDHAVGAVTRLLRTIGGPARLEAA